MATLRPALADRLADHMDEQARRLREVAAGAVETGSPLSLMLGGQEQIATALVPLDLIDDADALEADAAKLRNLYTRKG